MIFNNNKQYRGICIALLFAIISMQKINAATITSIANGNWSNPNTWQITTTKPGTIVAFTNSRIVTGSALADFTNNISVGNQLLNTSNQVIGVVASIQSATSLTLVANAAFSMNNAGWNSRGIGPSDDAVISSGNTVSVDGNFSCLSLTMQIANANNTLEISGTNTLNVTGNILMNVPNSGNTATINVNAGTINCASLTMNASTSGNNNIINITSGRLNINGNTSTGTTGCQINITSNGTLELGGSIGGFSLSLGSGASTVVYDANAAQTMRAMVYHNLTIGGSGIKTVTTSTTVNGTLTLEGTASLSSAINTYGANAGIRYNTSVARSTDVEWPSTFSGTGGITIANTGTISLEGTKNLSANVPMQVLANANFTSNNFAITFNGIFINAGTFSATTSVLTFNANLTNQGTFNGNSGQIRVSSDFINTGTYNGGSSQFNIRGATATQNIDGFSTTGIFLFSKTAGTATLLGNVTAGAITISGGGATLDFGTNRNHVFNAALTLSAGTLNGNTSTITFNGSTSGTGPIFNKGSSTVRFMGSAQNIPGFLYHNLELGGSGVKTMATNLNSIDNRFTISGTASVQQRATLGIGGDFVISDGAFFRAANFSLNIVDSLIIGGTNCLFRIGSIRSRQFSSIVINTGGSFVDSINSNYSISGHIRSNGTFSSGTGSINLTGIDKTISGNISFNNLVALSGSYTNNGVLTFNSSPLGAGSLTNGGSGVLNINFAGNVELSTLIANSIGNTVNYSFSGNQTVYTTDYFNLILSGSGTKTMSSNITQIANNFTLNDDIICTPINDINIGNNLSINNTANINFGNFTYTIGGNFTASFGTTLITSSANFIFTGNNKIYQNLNGNASLHSLQISNGRVSFLNNIFINDLIINANGIFDFAGFSASLEIGNSISGTGILKAGICNSATNNITLSGTNANMGTLFFDPISYHIQNLNLTKTTGSVMIGSSIGIEGILNLPNTGNASIEFTENLEFTNNFTINHTSNSPKVTLAKTASLAITDCGSIGGVVTIPSNLFITPPIIKKLSINKQNGLQLGNEVISLTEELSLINGTLNTNNNLVLLSSASKTARVAKVTGAIVGDVRVERFIPGGSNKRQWRFLSSPVNINGSIALTQYQDDIFVTGPSEAAGGFDVNPFANNASIRTYAESVSGSLNNGWTNPTNINNTIATGIGAEVFVRGSRNLANPFLNWTEPDNVTIDYIGALNTGNISPTISFTNTNSGSNDGFNLVGNPYASPINFDTTGWTKTNIENKYWCFNPNTTLWGSYNANSGESINGMTKYISSGQAFFIRATSTSPVIRFTEDVKSTSEGNNYFKGNVMQGKFPALKISLTNSYNEVDETLFILDPTSTYSSTDPSDMLKFYNNELNIYSVSNDRAVMSMNAIPLKNNTDTLGFSVWSYDTTSISIAAHQLHFSRFESIDSSIHLFLLDHYLNTRTNIRRNNTYHFMITSDVNSYGNNRFEIIFTNTNTSVLNNKTTSTNLVLYPNPSSDKIFLQSKSLMSDKEECNFEIFDILGHKISEGKLEFINSIANKNIEELNNGVYVLRVVNKGEFSVFRFIKK
jgi:Secretion system C-terminal sorting domain